MRSFIGFGYSVGSRHLRAGFSAISRRPWIGVRDGAFWAAAGASRGVRKVRPRRAEPSDPLGYEFDRLMREMKGPRRINGAPIALAVAALIWGVLALSQGWF